MITDHEHDCHICDTQLAEREEDLLIEQQVKSWNWDRDIFDIYDEIRDDDEYKQEALLRFAMKFFKSKDYRDSIIGLAYHLGVSIDPLEEDDND